MTKMESEEIQKALHEIAQGIVDVCFKSRGLSVGDYLLLIHRKRGAYGYCYVKRNWAVGSDNMREVAITDSALRDGKEAVFTTLAHEFVHAYNFEREVMDFRGRYHNKKFAEGCDKIGLKWEKEAKIGIRTPNQWNDEFERIYAGLSEEGKRVADGLVESDIKVEGDKPKDKNLKVHVCPECGAKARATGGTALVCGVCMIGMEVQE